MRDEMLKAYLQPSNMLFSMARWPDGRWRIANVTLGKVDLYACMAEADRMRPQLARMHFDIMDAGAVAHEFAILRPTFQEIEEFAVSRRDLA